MAAAEEPIQIAADADAGAIVPATEPAAATGPVPATEEDQRLLFDYNGARFMNNPVPSMEQRFLTFDSPIAETPPGFIGELHPNQKLILAEMIAMQENSTICTDESTVKGHDFDPNHGHFVRQSDVVRIAGAFSSGKTIVALAYICKRVHDDSITPPNLEVGERYAHQLVPGCHLHTCIPEFPVDTVIAKYKKPMFNAAIVLVAASMFDPWCENIKKHAPHLVVAKVKDVKSLKKFEDNYNNKKDGELSGCEHVNLILVKLGGNSLFNGNKQPILTSVAQILDGRIPRDIFVDDYDTAPLDNTPMWFAAHKIWLICVNIKREKGVKFNVGKLDDMKPYEKIMSVPMKFAGVNPSVMQVCSAEPHESCIPESFGCTQISYQNVVAKGNKKVVKLLKALDVDDDVMEMINADAMETAAQQLGGIASSPSELIKLILGDKYTKYSRFNNLLKVAKAHHAAITEFEATTEKPVKFDEDSTKYWNFLMKKGDAPDEILPENIQEYPLMEIQYAIEELTENVAKYSSILERFRDNLRNDDNTCSCCAEDCEGKDVFVVTACCSFMLCPGCISTNGKLIKACIFCAHPVSKKHFIFSPASNDVSDILDSDAIERAEVAAIEKAKADAEAAIAEEIAAAEEAGKEMSPYGTKLTILLELVKGDAELTCVRNRKNIACTVKGLLPFSRDVAYDDATNIKKYLVYTSQGETGKAVKAMFDEQNIPCLILNGSVSHRTNVLTQFREDPSNRVLVANNSQDCAGINLPYLSNVVFYNETDPKIMAQVIGRGHRLGRTFNLQVTHITYENENVRNEDGVAGDGGGN